MFAYCCNSPSSLKDSTGELAATATATAVIGANPVGALIALGAVITISVVNYWGDHSATTKPFSKTLNKNNEKNSNRVGVESQAGGTAAPMPPKGPKKDKFNKARNDGATPQSPKKVSDAYIQQNHIDAHGFKEHAGHVSRSQLSKFDIYQDTANKGKLWVVRKDGTDWTETAFWFIDLAEGWVK